MIRRLPSPGLLLVLLPALLLVLFLVVPAAAAESTVDAYVPWIRPGALYAEGRGELRWGPLRPPTSERTHCFEAQRGVEIDCASLATAGFIQRARLTIGDDGHVRRIDVVEMRQ